MKIKTALICAAAGLALGAAPASAHMGTPHWVSLSDGLVARQEVASATVGRSIYVIGGYMNGGTLTDAVERYDIDEDRWALVAPLPVRVHHAMAVAHAGNLYVVGGYTGQTPFSLGVGTGGIADATTGLWRYDASRNSWSPMPSAPTARAAAAAAVIGDKLYVAGGADLAQPLRTLEVFDFATKKWERGPDMPRATEHTAGAALHGHFYVVGGRPGYGAGVHRFVQRYLPEERRWERVADLAVGRAGFTAVAHCTGLIALGGEDPAAGPPGTIAAAERYDPNRNAWERLPDMPTPRHGQAGGVLGDRAYALEGGPMTWLIVPPSTVSEALEVPCGS
jgi:N-acetylneuraminic acid mutarotase